MKTYNRYFWLVMEYHKLAFWRVDFNVKNYFGLIEREVNHNQICVGVTKRLTDKQYEKVQEIYAMSGGMNSAVMDYLKENNLYLSTGN